MQIARTAAVIALVFVVGRAGETARSVDCVVRLDAGPVRGYIRTADRGAPYLSFRGIPYAAQPLGPLRFKPPERAETWTEVFDARHEGPACPQKDILYRGLMTPHGMSEACLHINVHVPLVRPSLQAAAVDSDTSRPPLPVLVFIHGGGFGFGSGDADIYGPEYLVTKGVIVVTFNYRLGSLGFLSLDTPELPGNAGLRDIVEALRWVQRNIEAFGGDPDNVTVAGQSAGGVAAHLLTLSPMARGLFHRLILMSGVATRSWISTSPINAKRQAATFLQKLNITTNDPGETFRALQSVDVDLIINATSEMQDVEGFAVFVPVVESKFDGVEAFLDEDPYTLVTDGRCQDVPVIIGYTDKECHTYARRFREINFIETAERQPVLLVPPSLIFESTPSQLDERTDKIKKRYFTGGLSDSSLENFIDYCTDSYFQYPALKLAEILSRRTSSSIFLYEFAYDGEYSPVKSEISGCFSGAGHIEDMTYVLRTNSFAGTIAADSHDEWVKEWMTVMFTNYIKTNDPTPELPGGQSLLWPAFGAESELSLVVNATIAVHRHRHRDLLGFFDDLHGPDRRPAAAAPSVQLLEPKTDK